MISRVICIVLLVATNAMAETKQIQKSTNGIYLISKVESSKAEPDIYLYCVAGFKVMIEKLGRNDGKPIACNE